MANELVEKEKTALKPIDIINGKGTDITPAQIEGAWVQLMSAQPPKKWLKNTNPQNPDNPFMKDSNGRLIPYMPIEMCENIMDKLLMQPQWKITNSGIGSVQSYDKKSGCSIVKSLAFMNVELKYYNHGLKEWAYTAGTASMEISGNFQWNLAFPKLLAEAKKVACKSLGNIFGRRIGREDMVVTEESISIKTSKKEEILNGIMEMNNENS